MVVVAAVISIATAVVSHLWVVNSRGLSDDRQSRLAAKVSIDVLSVAAGVLLVAALSTQVISPPSLWGETFYPIVRVFLAFLGILSLTLLRRRTISFKEHLRRGIALTEKHEQEQGATAEEWVIIPAHQFILIFNVCGGIMLGSSMLLLLSLMMILGGI